MVTGGRGVGGEEEVFRGSTTQTFQALYRFFSVSRHFLIISPISSSGVSTCSHCPVHTAHKFTRGIWDDKTGYCRVPNEAARDGSLPPITCVTFTGLAFSSSVSKFPAPDQPFGTKRSEGGSRSVHRTVFIFPFPSVRHLITALLDPPFPTSRANLTHRFEVDR